MNISLENTIFPADTKSWKFWLWLIDGTDVILSLSFPGVFHSLHNSSWGSPVWPAASTSKGSWPKRKCSQLLYAPGKWIPRRQILEIELFWNLPIKVFTFRSNNLFLRPKHSVKLHPSVDRQVISKRNTFFPHPCGTRTSFSHSPIVAWLWSYNVFGSGILAVVPARGVPFCKNKILLDGGLDLSQSIWLLLNNFPHSSEHHIFFFFFFFKFISQPVSKGLGFFPKAAEKFDLLTGFIHWLSATGHGNHFTRIQNLTALH